MKIGDLVRMNDTYPIWLLSVGLKRKDLGIILNIQEPTDSKLETVEVFWFSIGKSYLLQEQVLLKVNKESLK